MARVTASESGLHPHFKVRVHLPSSSIHLAAWDAPSLLSTGKWAANWIDDDQYGDTIGFIDWSCVVAVTWRFSP